MGTGEWRARLTATEPTTRCMACDELPTTIATVSLLTRLSERALELGIEYFTADVLAENRTMLALLRSLGKVQTESSGPVVTARIEIAEPPGHTRQNLLDLLIAAARGEIVSVPVLLRRLIRVPDEFSHLIRLPVTALLRTLRMRPPAE